MPIQQFIRNSNNERVLVDIAELSDIQTPTIQLVTIWAEQNGSIVPNRWDYSWGNGNEHNGNNINDWGWVAPYDGVIDVMTIGMRSSNTQDTTVVVTINGVNSAAQSTITGSATKVRNKLNTQVAFSAGDTLNFRTLAAGGGNDVVVTAALLLDITT